jgi:hypothetical protein
MDVMNRRFEPDFMTKLNYWMSAAKKKVLKTRAQKGSDEWIAQVQTSNWATHNEDAHWKVLQEYKNEQLNEEEVKHHIQMHKEGGS